MKDLHTLNQKLPMRSLAIIFTGCHPGKAHGWLHDIVQHFSRKEHTTAYAEFDGLYYRLESPTGVVELPKSDLPAIDIWFNRTVINYERLRRDPIFSSIRHKLLYPIEEIVDGMNCYKGAKIVKDDDFTKPVSDVFRLTDVGAKDSILYVAHFHERKGQLDFVRSIDPLSLHGAKVVFCGRIKERDYLEQVRRALSQKQIAHEIRSACDQEQLMHLYNRAYATVLYSRRDWNPRVIYESLSCGTPVLASNAVKLSKETEKHVLRVNRDSLNKEISRCIGSASTVTIPIRFLSKDRLFDSLIEKTIARPVSLFDKAVDFMLLKRYEIRKLRSRVKKWKSGEELSDE